MRKLKKYIRKLAGFLLVTSPIAGMFLIGEDGSIELALFAWGLLLIMSIIISVGINLLFE